MLFFFVFVFVLTCFFNWLYNSSQSVSTSNVFFLEIFGMGYFGVNFLVQGFLRVLLEAQGIFLRFRFLPSFDHPRFLKFRIPCALVLKSRNRTQSSTRKTRRPKTVKIIA